jgi:hypothetical protein
MAEKLAPAFTIDDVQRWERTLRSNEPPPLGPIDLTMLPGVQALSFGVSPYGLAVRIVTDAGANVDLFLNPVAAHALMQSIAGWGAKGGWVAPDGGLSIPNIPRSLHRDV